MRPKNQLLPPDIDAKFLAYNEVIALYEAGFRLGVAQRQSENWSASMGLEYRGNNVYYYRKERVNGHVVSLYGGSGMAALAFGALRLEDQQEREFERQERRKERDEATKILTAASSEWNEVEAVFESFMIDAGYHKYRGQWRKKRDAKAV